LGGGAFRRAKPIEDVMKDPRGLFHVGQLIGAADMVAHFCVMAEDEKTQRMGDRLAEAVDWFFTREGDKWDRPPVMPPKPS
jgi:hypothetical protein